MREDEYIIFKCEKIKEQKVAICPYGKWGKKVEKVLTEKENKEVICFDNYVDGVEKIDRIKNYPNIDVVFCCDNDLIYDELLNEVQNNTSNGKIIELFPRFSCGRHSYGPITVNYGTVERIGNFCSFAINTEVVSNHDVYISTHEFLSFNGDWEKHPGYVPGITVKHPRYIKKSVIGNDVWIGKNSTIIAGCNIGDGVIVGANSVVTHDVPDYAIVAGNPAKILKFRYNEKQIEELKKIEWWNWSDKKIKDNLDTFYYDVDDFIAIHRKGYGHGNM